MLCTFVFTKCVSDIVNVVNVFMTLLILKFVLDQINYLANLQISSAFSLDFFLKDQFKQYFVSQTCLKISQWLIWQ